MIALLPLSGKKFQNSGSWPMDYILRQFLKVKQSNGFFSVAKQNCALATE